MVGASRFVGYDFFETMEAEQLTLYTVEDYLEAEKVSEVKHEYLGGIVHAMSGASRRHNRISGAIYARLASQLASGPCEIYVEGVKVHIRSAVSEFFYYPDVMVGCDPDDGHEFYLENPCVIFEVASASTENTDRREKLIAYQSIASLQHYVIVAQDTMRVEWLRRSGNGWDLQTLTRPEERLEFPGQGAGLNLADIYEGLSFD